MESEDEESKMSSPSIQDPSWKAVISMGRVQANGLADQMRMRIKSEGVNKLDSSITKQKFSERTVRSDQKESKDTSISGPTTKVESLDYDQLDAEIFMAAQKAAGEYFKNSEDLRDDQSQLFAEPARESSNGSGQSADLINMRFNGTYRVARLLQLNEEEKQASGGHSHLHLRYVVEMAEKRRSDQNSDQSGAEPLEESKRCGPQRKQASQILERSHDSDEREPDNQHESEIICLNSNAEKKKLSEDKGSDSKENQLLHPDEGDSESDSAQIAAKSQMSFSQGVIVEDDGVEEQKEDGGEVREIQQHQKKQSQLIRKKLASRSILAAIQTKEPNMADKVEQFLWDNLNNDQIGEQLAEFYKRKIANQQVSGAVSHPGDKSH